MENYERLLHLLKNSKFESWYKNFQKLEPHDSFYENLYIKFPLEGMTWDVTDHIGKEFCPQYRLHGQIMNYLFAELTKVGGHTCADIKTLFDNFRHKINFPNLDKEAFKEALRYLVNIKSIEIRGSTIWHNFWYMSEHKVVYGLLEINSMSQIDLGNTSGYRGVLTDKQFAILDSIQKNRLTVVDGLPGTGKTTTAKKITEYLIANEYPVHHLAPTALAARNLAEKCGAVKGITMHSFVLRHSNITGKAAFIIDEFSMVETRIFSRFLEVIQNCDPIIVLVGDVGQLPSIGAGQLLKDMIQYRDRFGFAYHHLDEIIRQEKESEIIKNAHLIRKGDTSLKYQNEFIFVEQEEEDAAESIIKVSKKLAATNKNFVVLSPTHKGVCGVTSLNENLRDIFNPPSNTKNETRDGVWREGDRILVNHNFYDIGLVNGDIGEIKKIVKDDKFEIVIAGQSYSVDKDVISNLKLAYALTIHKSQGQEFDYVLIPFVNAFSIQLQRKLFYTAITRAKKQIYMFGHKSAINKAILSTREDFRKSGIKTLLDLLAPVYQIEKLLGVDSKMEKRSKMQGITGVTGSTGITGVTGASGIYIGTPARHVGVTSILPANTVSVSGSGNPNPAPTVAGIMGVSGTLGTK